MVMRSARWRKTGLAAVVLVAAALGVARDSVAQTSAAASGATARQIGTVKSLTAAGLTLQTDAGQPVDVKVAEGVKVLQIPPGSTSLKGAQEITLSTIQPGDRVLVTGAVAGDRTNSLEASRVILMKSSDIAQVRATQEADWQKRGAGGIVVSVDDGAKSIIISEGAKKVVLMTSPKTQFRRYAADSVKYEDAKPGSFGQIRAGDQLRARGDKTSAAGPGESMSVEEVISGSFRNVAGVIAGVDAADQTVSLKDLATKKMVTVKVLPTSSVRALPAQAAARFAVRAKAGAGSADPHAAPAQTSGASTDAGAQSAGTDLSQLVSHLPNGTFADLKAGNAVMIVASQPDPASSSVTAVTVLSGVEPILAATPSGGQAMKLSPWNIGGGGADSSQ